MKLSGTDSFHDEAGVVDTSTLANSEKNEIELLSIYDQRDSSMIAGVLVKDYIIRQLGQFDPFENPLARLYAKLYEAYDTPRSNMVSFVVTDRFEAREMKEIKGKPWTPSFVQGFSSYIATAQSWHRVIDIGMEIELREIVLEAQDEGWDGYGAKRVSNEAVSAARQFIALIPDGIRTPNLVPEPSGHISFEWRTEDKKALSVTVEPNRIIFGSLLGAKSKQFGRAPFDPAGLPDVLVDILKRYFSE